MCPTYHHAGSRDPNYSEDLQVQKDQGAYPVRLLLSDKSQELNLRPGISVAFGSSPFL